MSNQQIAADVLKLVGGKENINNVVHCATRLRFKLKDESIAKTEELKDHPGVVQVVQSGGQYQVVIGNHVSEVHKELVSIAGLGEGTSDDDAPKEKQGIVSTFIDIISSIFTPFLGALAGTAVLKGILNISVFMGWISTDTGGYQILYAAADAFIYFLPIALAITSARKFKTNEFLAAALAMAMLYPGLLNFAAANGSLDFFGIPVIFSPDIGGYASTVIPIILAVFIQSKVERFVRSFMPRAISIFGVAGLTILVMVPLTYIVIGPLGLVIGSVLGNVIAGVYDFNAVLAGIIIGGLWQVLVVFGMHWGLVPIVIMNLGANGFDSLLPLVAPAIIAQAAASVAVAIKAKDIKLKGLASSGAITATFGITEPTVYGVTLPLKKPFIAACIGGAIGGAINGFFSVKAFAFSSSILIIPNMVSTIEGVESNVVAGVIAMATAATVAIVLTFVLGFDEKKQDKALEEAEKEEMKEVAPVTKVAANEVITSPLTGDVVKLEDVQDQVFSSGAMGKGVAVEPTVGELRAPANGVITTIFPTGHAVGVTTDEGAEILMHIGMDTVEMNGEGFTAHVKQGDKIKAGDLLVEFDIEAIKAAGKLTVTPVIITNTMNFSDVLPLEAAEVKAGEEFITIVKNA